MSSWLLAPHSHTYTHTHRLNKYTFQTLIGLGDSSDWTPTGGSWQSAAWEAAFLYSFLLSLDMICCWPGRLAGLRLEGQITAPDVHYNRIYCFAEVKTRSPALEWPLTSPSAFAEWQKWIQKLCKLFAGRHSSSLCIWRWSSEPCRPLDTTQRETKG